ncbi:MAG: DMT family transporter [Rhodocyclaceae bacterium]|nr:DMT family transporter [Rhodocyclaceae bacterium]
MQTDQSRSVLVGSLCMLLAAVCWGGMFPVAKSALTHLDPYILTAVRYGVTAPVMLAILWRLEGRAAFRPDGRALQLLLFGSAGFAGFGLLALSGLRASTPAHGAILVALMPMLTVLLDAAASRRLPPAHTRLSILMAFGGVALVVSNGHPAALLESPSALADGLILVGVLCWVVYTMGGRHFAGWSPLRYSALTVSFGVIAIGLCAVLALAGGAAHLPTLETLGDTAPQLAYMVIFASVVAVIGWNEGIRRVGPVNGVLFINFVPITAFTVQALRGAPFSGWELGGAGLVVAALTINNLLRQAPPPALRQPPQACPQGS